MFLAVAVAGLASDRSEVDSQVRGPNRAYAPGVGRVILHVGQAVPQPLERWWKVVIQLTANDTDPLPCGATCPDPTKIQVESVPARISETSLTAVASTFLPKMTDLDRSRLAQDPNCTLYREFQPGFPEILIEASGSIFTGVSVPYVEVLKVDYVSWQYRCESDTYPGDPFMGRDLWQDYLQQMFPNGLIVTTQTNPAGGQLPSCITHYGLQLGRLDYDPKATAAIQIFIYVGGMACNIPDFPFPY